MIPYKQYITVSGTGDKQIGFCRNGINFKASIDTLNILRGFFTFMEWVSQIGDLIRHVLAHHKISGFKKSFPDSRKVDKRINTKSRLCLILTTCTMIIYGRVAERVDASSVGKNLSSSAFEGGPNRKVSKHRVGSIPTPANIYGITQRVMTFFASCEQIKYSIRFDRWNETNKYLNALHGR